MKYVFNAIERVTKFPEILHNKLLQSMQGNISAFVDIIEYKVDPKKAISKHIGGSKNGK